MEVSDATPRYTVFPTTVGPCGIGRRDNTVIVARLPDPQPDQTLRSLAKRTGGHQAQPNVAIARAIAAVTQLLDGEKTDLGFIACELGTNDPFALEG